MERKSVFAFPVRLSAIALRYACLLTVSGVQKIRWDLTPDDCHEYQGECSANPPGLALILQEQWTSSHWPTARKQIKPLRIASRETELH